MLSLVTWDRMIDSRLFQVDGETNQSGQVFVCEQSVRINACVIEAILNIFV
jgi:hypothetical protein